MADVRLLSIKQALDANGDDVVSALHQLNTLLDYSTRADVARAASVISVQQLFEFLGTGGGGVEEAGLVEACCGALEKIFRSLEPREVCQYGGYMELGLQHSSERVRQTCLDTLLALLGDSGVQRLVTTPTVFHLVTQTIGDESLRCASAASDILLNLTAHGQCSVETLAAELQGVKKCGDAMVRCRVYEVAVKVASSSDTHMTYLSAILVGLVQELDGDDVLVQLNCIELLILLMGSRGGEEFLHSHRVAAKLHGMLSVGNNPFCVMVIPGVMKFFGHLCCVQRLDVEALCSQHPMFLCTLLESIHHPEEGTTWGVAADTFGVLGSRVPGRRALRGAAAAGAPSLEGTLRELGRLAREGRSEVRVRALRALNAVLSCRAEGEREVEEESRRWLGVALPPRPGAAVLSIARQPFSDLHTEALGIVLSLARSEWGQEELKAAPGFVEYLLDRRTELERTGKELKHGIVHALVTSYSVERVFGSSVLVQLRKFDREGPFFAGEGTVAFEEA